MSAVVAPTGTGPPTQEQVAEYRRRGWWRDETFLDDLRRHARERPHKLAIAGRRVAESRTDTLDYAELAELAERFADALLELGVRPGDVVAVLLPNRWEMVALVFACIRAGALICPISPVCPEEELRHRFETTGAVVCVTVPRWSGEPLADRVLRLEDELPTLHHVLVVDGPVPPGARSFHEHFVATEREGRTGAGPDGHRELTADDPFVVLFTSGTTGESKGVVHSQNTVHSAVRGYADAFAIGPDWVAAVSTPLVHYSGFAQGVLTGVLVGGTVAFQDVRRNEILPDLVERHRATLLYGPPATLVDVVAAQRAVERDTSTLTQVVIGSAPVLAELAEEIRTTLGARTYSLWGMSEVGPVTMTRPDDPADRASVSNGRPIDAVRIRLDPAAGAGGAGRLAVRGASLALGYHGRPAAFAAQFDEEGWFDTGDLARDDGDGGIRIVGRARDAIVRDGRVAPMVELEAVIGSHPDTVEAALVELPAPAGGSGVICAVVVPSGARGPSGAEVRARLSAAGHDPRFLPERVESVRALPKTLTGKIRKAELRERLAGS